MAALTVVQTLPALDSGGVERGTLEITEALVKAGHRAIVISAGGRLVTELESIGGQHLQWPIGRKNPLTLTLVSRLRRLLVAQSVDIVHARSRLPAWITYLAWRSLAHSQRPRLVTTVHGFYTVNRYSAIMTRGERVIAVSDAIKHYITENYPNTPLQRIEVIYRGVDAQRFPYGFQPSAQWRTQWYAQYPYLRNKFVITLPGRVTALKGHREFLQLMATLRHGGHDVHGLVVGAQSNHHRGYAEQLKHDVLNRSLPITFVGYREDMREVYALSDLVLSLSTQPESFGRSVLEPLCQGRAVIGFDHGGVGEILRTSFPQGAVAAGDSNGLHQRVVEFMTAYPTMPQRLDYPLSAMQERTLNLYQNLKARTADP